MPLSEGWKKTIEDGLRDYFRFIWDPVVRAEVNDYNRRLAKTPGYVIVDWKLILAVLWVESGPKNADWFTWVMQIGKRKADGGYDGLKKHEGATNAVVRKDLLELIDKADRTAFANPFLNIQAGIAYLFERMALSEPGSIINEDDLSLHQHVFSSKKDGTGSSVAHTEGTTVEELRTLNPGVNIDRIHDGQVLFFHKAHPGRKIVGWLVFNEDNIARRYNVKGDSSYAEKLRYVVTKLTSR